MTYPINKTDGTLLVNLPDGTRDTSTGLTLIGRNFPNYGELQNENFVKLLENFADDIPPTESSIALTPLAGTLWWDTGAQRLKIYNGTEFNSVSPLVESATAPTANNIGDQWWDTVNNQLKTWTGGAWQLIGPLYTQSQGKSGPVVETLLDNTNVPHTVVTEYVDGQVISVSSVDTFILLSTTYGFTAIQQGINLPGNKVVEGNAYVGGYSTLGADAIVNGQLILARLNGTTPESGAAVIPGTNNIYDIGSGTQAFRNIFTSGNLVLTNANLFVSGGALIAQNKNYGGNVDVYVNATANGNVKAISISGTDGLVYVSNDPTQPLGVATKQYADAVGTAANSAAAFAIASTNSNVAILQNQFSSNIVSLVNSLAANVARIDATNTNQTDNITNLGARIDAANVASDANVTTLTSSINSINNALSSFAPLTDPAFGGNPTAPTPGPGDNTVSVATTGFVTGADNLLKDDYNFKIDSLTASSAANLALGLATKASIASPTFTGVPRAPRPTDGDNSTQIATTNYVTQAIANQKFNYTVSANSPTGGNDGDFWFQIG
jgi:hypothetical protein